MALQTESIVRKVSFRSFAEGAKGLECVSDVRQADGLLGGCVIASWL